VANKKRPVVPSIHWREIPSSMIKGVNLPKRREELADDRIAHSSAIMTTRFNLLRA
jgi:hypothetical protein